LLPAYYESSHKIIHFLLFLKWGHMTHTNIDVTQVSNFIREQRAPFLFNSSEQSEKEIALAIASRGEDTVGKLRGMILRSRPLSRIFHMKAPQGKDSLKQFREFISELLYHLGEPPLRHGQESAVAARLQKVLSSRYDYVIIENAELLGAYSLDLLRRYRGGPAVLLVASNDQILDTLLASDVLQKSVYLLG